MNTNKKKRPIELKLQRHKLLPKPQSKQPVLSGDMWEALHGDLRNFEHERHETRLTR